MLWKCLEGIKNIIPKIISFLALTFLNSQKQNLKLGIHFDIYGKNLIFQIKQKILIDDYNFVAHC